MDGYGWLWIQKGPLDYGSDFFLFEGPVMVPIDLMKNGSEMLEARSIVCLDPF